MYFFFSRHRHHRGVLRKVSGDAKVTINKDASSQNSETEGSWLVCHSLHVEAGDPWFFYLVPLLFLWTLSPLRPLSRWLKEKSAALTWGWSESLPCTPNRQEQVHNHTSHNPHPHQPQGELGGIVPSGKLLPRYYSL